MSEYDENRSPARSASGGGSENNSNDNTLTEDANNSIIGKVKSRVSSIIPNRFSKWFSPSAAAANNSGSSSGNNNNNNNDSINGNLSVNVPRRRRFFEVEDDEEHESLQQGEYPLPYNNNRADLQRDDTGGNSDDDDSNNSDDDGEPAPLNVSARRPNASIPPANVTMSGNDLPVIHVRRQHFSSQQPPAKRTRMNPADMSDSPMLLNHHKPLVASTPATTGRPGHLPAAGRLSALRHRHLHGGNAPQRADREAPYNFTARDTNAADIDIIDLVPVEESSNTTTRELSSSSNRRSLTVPQFGGERPSLGFGSDLKRLPLYSQHGDEEAAGPSGHGLMASRPALRTSTTIHESSAEEANSYATMKYNGQHTVPPVFVPHKRAKLMNGSGSAAAADYLPDVEEEPQCVDTASESSECSAAAGADVKTAASGQQVPRKTGLFNLTGRSGPAAGSSGGGPSSASGNGLNFFTHLEGRKSLFAGNHATNQSLNSSTLSLNALNRRQFNASIYGSTSALSDSRLLNTFSPFYKGRTTYGGAAAYNKYMGAAGVTGAGASSIRITPTMIRPTSSLSVLSGSSTSLTGAAGGQGSGGDPAPMSNAAKRILDMINDFATPLSEAKKMANNVKTAQYLNASQAGAAKGRLNETDLNASRAVRLSQVRTPYKRPSVMLASSSTSSSGPANGKSPNAAALPPTRELQVPSMSQLLQLKKMQTSTERARHIAAQSQAPREYKLPVEQAGASDEAPQSQQKHVSKIKNRHNAAARATGSNAANLLDDEPLPPVNLPNIAFPLMQSVPKFDIALPPAAAAASSSAAASSQPAVSGASSSGATKPLATSSAAATFAFKGFTAPASSGSGSVGATTKTVTTPPAKTFATAATGKSPQPATPMFTAGAPAKLATPPSSQGAALNFKFSQPLALAGDYSQSNASSIVYKFSPPAPLAAPGSAGKEDAPAASKPAVPQLKTGSVLDALKKPFLPAASKPATSGATAAPAPTTSTVPNSFGAQFKKSSAEWECDTCMIRNKQEASKCVACETPRKTAAPTPVAAPLSTSAGFTSSFGDQFKKSSAEWECDTCMIRNKQEASKCVACETPRKQAAAPSMPAAAKPLVASSFGDAFKPKANTWECPTCMISNKADAMACVACETKKPGASAAATTSAAATPKFSFGFAAAGAPAAEPAAKMDSKFKSLAAEQASAKWECEACMTRNDNGRSKCVCCEQAKPGCEAAASSGATAKFSFGSSAAAQKFSFGFGAAAAAATTTTTTQKTETTTTTATTGFVFGSKATSSGAATTTTTTATTGGFSFGLKPAATATSSTTTTTSTPAAPAKDGAADSTKAAAPLNATFKFGAPAATSAAATASTGFSFGSPAPAAATTSTSTTATNKSDATTTSETPAKSLTTAKPAFTFGSSATPTFGTAAKADSTAAGSSDQSQKTAGSTFGSFGGASSASALPSFGSPSTNATPTFGSPSSTASAAPKAMFAFGAASSAATSSAVSSSAATTSSTAAPTTATSSTGLFSFGSSGASATAAKTPLFGDAVSSSSSATSSAAGPLASSNLFGSGSAASAATPLFGDASKVSSTTATTTTTATFGGFGVPASSTTTTSTNSGNLFGSATPAPSFGSDLEQKAATPLFGSLGSSSSGTAAASGATASATPFTFGGASAGATGAAATPSATGPTAQWPKSQFVFGSGSGSTAAAATPAPSTEQKPVFGSFGGSGAQQTATVTPAPAATSLFGSQSTPATGPPPPFGAATATPVFGANSTPSTNVFGSGNAAASGTANAQPPPAFGAASPFGASSGGLGAFGRTGTPGATMSMVAPQQSTAAPSFGGFGASNNNNNNTVTDGASAPKKSEPAFNFGSGQQSSAQGAFQFGAPAAAPTAFNFGATSTGAPTFNFSGTAESHQQTAKPFQFGATPAPVFGFGSGAAAEATPNAPFQFNAGGAAPATTNIFAPPPIGNQASAQQARRKIRQPIRRSTPR